MVLKQMRRKLKPGEKLNQRVYFVSVAMNNMKRMRASAMN